MDRAALAAIWIPPNAIHEVVTLERARLRALYVFARGAAPFQDGECVVVDVSPLMRELIIALLHVDAMSLRESLLSELILDELSNSATLPMRVALPKDKRLKVLCETLIADPASPLTLDDMGATSWCIGTHAGALFEQDLGLTFGQWRQQMRLAHAAPLIARGLPLSRVAPNWAMRTSRHFPRCSRKPSGNRRLVLCKNLVP